MDKPRKKLSASFISGVTDKLLDLAKEWQSRPLASVYAVVFFYAIHYNVRKNGQVINEARLAAIPLTTSV